MLTRLLFQTSEVDLLEEYKKAYQRKCATILGLDYSSETSDEVGSIIYSIFDFSFLPHDIEDALAECSYENYGEVDFFKWVIKNKKKLEAEITFLDKIILFQEIDLNITQINRENILLVLDAVKHEHNIFTAVVAPETFYVSQTPNLKKIFLKMGWKGLSNKYYFKM